MGLISNPSPIASTTVTLTDAQIKALPTTPAVIIPPTDHLDYSGAPSQIPLVLGGVALLNNLAGLYTNVNTPAVLSLAIGSDVSLNYSDTYQQGAVPSGSAIPDFDTDAHSQFAAAAASDWLLAFAGSSRLSYVSLNGQIFDNALVLTLSNGGLGALTGGDVANTLAVTVFYATLPIPA